LGQKWNTFGTDLKKAICYNKYAGRLYALAYALKLNMGLDSLVALNAAGLFFMPEICRLIQVGTFEDLRIYP